MPLNEIKSAISVVFKAKKYFYLFIFSSIIALALYIAVPVLTIPGNDLNFWLAIMPWWGYLALLFFSFSLGLLITMHYYTHKQGQSVSAKSKGMANVLAVLVSGLYSTAACAACLSTIFAFLGSGGVFFINTHRFEFTLLSIVFILISIYLTSEKINDNCEDCKVPLKRKSVSVN